MVNRMPGSSVYNGRNGAVAAAVRARNLSSMSGKGESVSTNANANATVSPSSSGRTTPKAHATTPSTGRVGGNATRDVNTGIENMNNNMNNNSTRSTESASTSTSEGSARKMRRGSFRRTLLMQRNKRNSGSSSQQNNTSNSNSNSNSNGTSNTSNEGAKSTSITIDPPPASNRWRGGVRPQASTIVGGSSSDIGSDTGTYHDRSSALFLGKGTVGTDPTVTMAEEREAGACSPTFPPSTPAANASVANHKTNAAFPMDEVGGPQQELQELPRGHVETILRMYGTNASNGGVLDLYKDVLLVSPEASDREIRIAYFRRGREILGDTASGKNKDKRQNQQAVRKLDPATKSRFQAVSMAYEILSTPAWKKAYRKQGGLRKLPPVRIRPPPAPRAVAVGQAPTSAAASPKVSSPKRNQNQPQEAFDPFAMSPLRIRPAFPDIATIGMGDSTTSSPAMAPKPPAPKTALQPASAPPGKPQHPPTALRKSSFAGNGSNSSRGRRFGLRKPSSASVRWKDHVEELVFVKHPNENASDGEDTEDEDSDYDSSDNEDFREDSDGSQNGSVRAENGLLFSSADPPQDLYSDPSLSGRGSITTRDSIFSHGSSSGSNRRRKKNKERIVIDSEELESHLKRMDSEAEKHFVQDFWDNFEESMDGILSLVDSLGGGGGDASSKTNKKKIKSSSWLMPSPSFGNQQTERKNNPINGDTAADPDTTMRRSISHDATTPSSDSNTEGIDKNDLMQSNSLPASLSPAASNRSDAVSSPLQRPPTTGATVTPDEKDEARQSPRTASSPYDMILNSWPFQSSSKSEDEADAKKKQQPQHPQATPVIVSPGAKVALVTPVIVSPVSRPGTTGPPSETASIASTILSTSQRRRKSLFRPISPPLSEASEAINSDIVSAASPTPSSEAFELDSRLSEMDSVDLTTLDNPFRRGGKKEGSTKEGSPMATSSPSPSKDIVIQQTASSDSINSTSSKGSKKKKKSRFRVSMMSRILGSPSSEREISSSVDAAKTTEKATASSSSTKSKQASEEEDVFAGVDDVSSKQQQPFDESENKNVPNALEVESISMMKRSCSASQMSDLSESVYSTSKKESDINAQPGALASLLDKSPARPSPDGASNRPSLTVTFSPSVAGSCSVMSESTKKSLVHSTTGRSEGSAYSSVEGVPSANSLDFESTGVETAGFFDYLVAYATAVMTECANLGAATGAAEYQQDFMNLFAGDTSVQTAEIREQPSTLRRVPSESTTSSHTF